MPPILLYTSMCIYICLHIYTCRCSIEPDSCDLVDCSPEGSFCPWDSPGKNVGMSWHALLQGIFPTQGSNPCLLRLLHWQAGLAGRFGRWGFFSTNAFWEAPVLSRFPVIAESALSSIAWCPRLCGPVSCISFQCPLWTVAAHSPCIVFGPPSCFQTLSRVC